MSQSILDGSAVTGRDKLAFIVETVREMSRQTDPQAMVRAFGVRMRQLLQFDRLLSLSRRDLERPRFRITRYSLWKDDVDPWHERQKLPMLSGGILGELIYGDEPQIIDDLALEGSDPAAPFLAGQRSLMAIPNYDKGVAMNMVVMTHPEPGAFDRTQFPEWVWLSNLFGQAAYNLVRAQHVQRAYEEVDREMQTVEEIQHSLLPAQVPPVPTLDLAIHYKTSRRAGGDYYDFFELPDGRWGIFIGDVSGHGTPAAVIMAVTHSLAHTHPGPRCSPGEFLGRLNRILAERYTGDGGTFVTAFYGVYDPATRELRYANAGHNPPRVKRCADGTRWSLDAVANLPLGISPTEVFPEHTEKLRPGDQIVFYTDGIIEADNRAGQPFGMAGLDRVIAGCANTAPELLDELLYALERFTEGTPAEDDRTLVIAKVN